MIFESESRVGGGEGGGVKSRVGRTIGNTGIFFGALL